MPTIIRRSVLFFSMLLFGNTAFGATIKDVDIPEQIVQPDTQQTLVLNGAGIRSKFFFSIYIGALYLPAQQTSVSAILESDTPRRIMMHCLYDEISKEKLNDAWDEGFNENSSEQMVTQLRERIDKFSKLFPALHKGDVVYLDYSPDIGTRLTFNNNDLGVIPGADFNIALLKVWLGEHPADSNLKSAMIGERQ